MDTQLCKHIVANSTTYMATGIAQLFQYKLQHHDTLYFRNPTHWKRSYKRTAHGVTIRKFISTHDHHCLEATIIERPNGYELSYARKEAEAVAPTPRAPANRFDDLDM